jgi:hypothetical protein
MPVWFHPAIFTFQRVEITSEALEEVHARVQAAKRR